MIGRLSKTKNRKGFTLIELMIAMLLMTMVTATCIWVFRQSLGIYNKSTGNAEVNQNWRIAMEKINQDLSACLPLSSGEQRFIMISRAGPDLEFSKPFPRDYLSFATTTRVQGDTTTALVSYDITETASELPILWRYITKIEDLGTQEPLEDNVAPNSSKVYREVLAEYCTMFRVEYLWEDPRPVDPTDTNGDMVWVPSDGPELVAGTHKNVPDPGVFLSLNPIINKDGAMAIELNFVTGGFNGANVLANEADGREHAGNGTGVGSVLQEFYTSSLFDRTNTGGVGGNPNIVIPFRGLGNPEPCVGKMGMVRKVGGSAGVYTDLASAGLLPGTYTDDDYNRAIVIMSPNLWFGSTLDPSDTPLDITAAYSENGDGTTQLFDDITLFADYYNSGGSVSNGYLDTSTNGNIYPTYVPPQLRITMKIYNKSRTSMITRTKTFWIPSSGS